MGDVIHKRINENQPAVMKQPTKESGLTFKLDCRFSRVGLCPRKAPERLPYRRLGNHFSRRRLFRWNKTHKRELGTSLLFLALQIQAVIETNLRNVTVLGCPPKQLSDYVAPTSTLLHNLHLEDHLSPWGKSGQILRLRSEIISNSRCGSLS